MELTKSSGWRYNKHVLEFWIIGVLKRIMSNFVGGGELIFPYLLDINLLLLQIDKINVGDGIKNITTLNWWKIKKSLSCPLCYTSLTRSGRPLVRSVESWWSGLIRLRLCQQMSGKGMRRCRGTWEGFTGGLKPLFTGICAPSESPKRRRYGTEALNLFC